MFNLLVFGGGAALIVYVLVAISAPKRPSKQPSRTQRPPVAGPKDQSVKAKPHLSVVQHEYENTVTGHCYVIDGDTIRIGNVNIRLAGIDAPELNHPWGQKAKWELVALCKGHRIRAELEPEKSYDRVVATCYLPDGRDLSAEMVKCGLALDWPKFSKGKYADLEPEGARKKHWKAAAKQRGHMSVFNK